MKQNNNNNNFNSSNNSSNSNTNNTVSKCKLTRKNSSKNSCKKTIKKSSDLEKKVKVSDDEDYEDYEQEEEEEVGVDTSLHCRPIHIKIKLKRNSFLKNITNKKEQVTANKLIVKKPKDSILNTSSSSVSMDSFRKNIGQDEKKLIKFIYGQQYVNDNNSMVTLPSSNRSSIVSNNGTVKSNRVKFNEIIEMYDPGLKNRSSFSMNDNISLIKSLNMQNENKLQNDVNGNVRSVSYQIPNGNINKLINKPIDRKDLKLSLGQDDIINEQNQTEQNKINREEFRINKFINKSPTVPLPPTPPVHLFDQQPPLFSEQPKQTELNSKIKKLSVATQTLNISFNKDNDSEELKKIKEETKKNDSKQETDKPQESSNCLEPQSTKQPPKLVKSKTAENVTNSKLYRADSFEQKLNSNETKPISSKPFKIDTLGLVDNKISFKRDEIDLSTISLSTTTPVITNPTTQAKKPQPQLRRVVEIKTSTLPDFKYQQHSVQTINKNESSDSDSKSKSTSESTNAINESFNTTRELEVNIELKTNNTSNLSSQYSIISGETDTLEVKNKSIANDNNTSYGSNDTLLFENNSSMNNLLETTSTRQQKYEAFRRRSNFRSGDHQYEQELNEIFKKMYDRHRSIQTSVSSDENNSILSFRRSFSYTNSNNATTLNF